MKKQFFSLCILSVLVQFSLSFGQEDMVKLVRSENYDVCNYGEGCSDNRNILMQVKNVAYEKQVFVHQKMYNGSWIDFPAHYEGPGNSTYELWHFDTVDISYSFGYEFVLKYVVLGQTFWDNNNGANYILTRGSGNGPGPMLGNYINVFLRSASISGGQLHAAIDIKNIAYAKDVALIYTTDNWVNSTTLNASFQSMTQTGYSSFIYWPNLYNIERWNVVSPGSVSGPVQFYIRYTVNGQTYYDNNYWANYVLTN